MSVEAKQDEFSAESLDTYSRIKLAEAIDALRRTLDRMIEVRQREDLRLRVEFQKVAKSAVLAVGRIGGREIENVKEDL